MSGASPGPEPSIVGYAWLFATGIASVRQRYHLHGLTIDSAMALPELLGADDGMPTDVTVDVVEALPMLTDATTLGPHSRYTATAFQFTVPDIAHYQVEAGRHIRLQPLPGAVPHDVRLYLLGTAMAAILHQRRLLPLHIGAVATASGAWAFTGPSGAGKSTLTAAFGRHGYPILTDDVAVVRETDTSPQLWPGFPRLKLWRDALEHFQLTDQPLILDYSRTDKFHLPLHSQFRLAPTPLTALCWLEHAEPGEAATLTRLSKLDAVRVVAAATYRHKLVSLGSTERHLQQCAQVARRIAVYRYRRTWSLDRLDDQLAPLLATMPAPC